MVSILISVQLKIVEMAKKCVQISTLLGLFSVTAHQPIVFAMPSDPHSELCKMVISKVLVENVYGSYTLRYDPWTGSNKARDFVAIYEKLIDSSDAWKPAGRIIPREEGNIYWPPRIEWNWRFGGPTWVDGLYLSPLLGKQVAILALKEMVKGTRDRELTILTGKLVNVESGHGVNQILKVATGVVNGVEQSGLHWVNLPVSMIQNLHYSDGLDHPVGND